MIGGDIGWALGELRSGRKVTRAPWGRDAYIVLVERPPNIRTVMAHTHEETIIEEDSMTLVDQANMDYRFIVWPVQLDDILATDWEVVP